MSTSSPTDLTDAAWAILRPWLPPRAKRGRPPTDRRVVINAIRYWLRAGCAWRRLPSDFGPWSAIDDLYRCWTKRGLWQKLHDRLRDKVRPADGRTPQPSAAVLDAKRSSWATKVAPAAMTRARKPKGVSGTSGWTRWDCSWGAHVGAADPQDRDGAKPLLQRVLGWYGRLAKIWAAGGYAGALVAWVKALRPRGKLHWEIVRRSDSAQGFEVLPKRWIVERTFAWRFKQRRLARDYEVKGERSEALLYIAMSGLMLRRLARQRRK